MIALTQVLPHLLEVVQIIRHGVGEVHEDIQIHGALQGLKHLEHKAALLTRSQPDLQALGRHLAAVQGGVNLGVLCPREWGSLLEGHSGDLRGHLRPATGHHGPQNQPVLCMESPACHPIPGTSVMSRLLSMTRMLSPRQPAARSSAWVLQRRSLNSWPEADGLGAGDGQALASPIPGDFLLTLLTLTSFPHPSGLGLGRAGGKSEAGQS